MSNETIKLLGAAYRAALFGLGNGAIVWLKKQGKGKTHTIKALRKGTEHIVKIHPATPSAMLLYLTMNAHAHIFYIDDKDRWAKNIFSEGLKFAKGIGDGEIAPIKMTKFDVEQTTQPVQTKAWVIIALNLQQYDLVFTNLLSTGLYERALILRTQHTDKEIDRINDEYENRKWDKKTGTPDFYIPEDYYTSYPRILSKEEIVFIKTLDQPKQDTVTKIMKVINQKYIPEMMPYLITATTNQYFTETIEFEKQEE